MFSCLLTEGHARDMKGMFITYLGSNIEALFTTRVLFCLDLLRCSRSGFGLIFQDMIHLQVFFRYVIAFCLFFLIFNV